MSARKPPVQITSQKIVDGLPFALDTKKPVFYWDAGLKGFGVKASQRTKTYVVEAQVKGRTVRVKIDSCSVIDHGEARKRAMGLLSSMHQGQNPNEAKRVGRHRGKTFGEVCEEYLRGKELTENTCKDYRRHMRKTLAKWADQSFLDIGRESVEKTYRDAVTRKVTGASGEIRELTAAQANQAFRFARSVFNFAKRYHGEDGRPLLHDNPVDVLSEGGLWRRVAKRTNYVKRTQLRAVWEALWAQKNNERALNIETVRDFLLLMLFTGLRLNEARLLRWETIDMAEETLTIPDPKNHQPHVLPFSDYLAAFFRRRLQAAEGSSWVFPSEIGERKKPIVEYRGVLEAVCVTAGVTFTPHDLRRSFLTYTKELPAKYGPFFTKRLANHKVSDVTAGYVQISQQELRKCMQDITNYILDNAHAQVSRIGMIEPPRPPKQKVARQINLKSREKIIVHGGQ